jgi:hypothetical protein
MLFHLRESPFGCQKTLFKNGQLGTICRIRVAILDLRK